MRLKSILFATAILTVMLVSANNNFSLKTVVIDAGHGGKDPGAIGATKTNEKDIALVVALKLGDYISKNFPDVNVIYTRKTDVFLELHERAEIANKNKADLFIAIHCNSSTNHEAFGTSSYVLGLHRTEANLEVAKRENSVILLEEDRDKNYEFDPNSPEGHIIMSMKQNAFLDQSIDFASKIENQLENYSKRKSLGVKQAGFYVLYKTSMPSLLAEIGFISNPEEEKFLNSVKGQDQVASSLFNAFRDYKTEMEGSGGEPITVEAPKEIKTETKAATTEVKTESKPTNAKPVETKTEQPAKPANNTPVEVKAIEPVAKADNAVTLKNGKNIRKPIENSNGGGKSNASVTNKVDDVKPIYVTASDLNPFDTSSMSSAMNKPANKPTTSTTTEVASKPANKPAVSETETKPATNETKTESKSSAASNTNTEVKIESNRSSLVAIHKSEPGNVFKVQLFALKGELKDYVKISKLFSTITGEDLPNGITRYFAGNTKTYSDAKKLLDTAKSAGYSAAYIVGFKDGVRMSTDQLKAFEQ
ncbi:MAG: N-acetylmuramoyl-L-alanine amidase [Chitinophagales bacterium]